MPSFFLSPSIHLSFLSTIDLDLQFVFKTSREFRHSECNEQTSYNLSLARAVEARMKCDRFIFTTPIWAKVLMAASPGFLPLHSHDFPTNKRIAPTSCVNDSTFPVAIHPDQPLWLNIFLTAHTNLIVQIESSIPVEQCFTLKSVPWYSVSQPWVGDLHYKLQTAIWPVR